MLNENEIKVLKALSSPENWRPRISKIVKDTGVKMTTVSDTIKRFYKTGNMSAEKARAILDSMEIKEDE